MAEEVFFEESLGSSTSPMVSPPVYKKPDDSLYPPAPAPHTTFYLSTIRPHTDTYTIVGPVTHFSHLLGEVMAIVSNSPAAIDKMEALRETKDAWGDTYEVNEAFETNGFDTLVVAGQRGIYTVLKIERRVDERVYEHLPAPVYTVISAGPLRQPGLSVALASGRKYAAEMGVEKPQGYAATTRLLGSFVERSEAMRAAQGAMQALLQGQSGVRTTENWDTRGKGTGVLMAMDTAGSMWEVRVVYEDQALRRAREGLDLEGAQTGWRI